MLLLRLPHLESDCLVEKCEMVFILKFSLNWNRISGQRGFLSRTFLTFL